MCVCDVISRLWALEVRVPVVPALAGVVLAIALLRWCAAIDALVPLSDRASVLADSDGESDSDGDSDGESDSESDIVGDEDSDSDSDSDGDGDGDGDSDGAQIGSADIDGAISLSPDHDLDGSVTSQESGKYVKDIDSARDSSSDSSGDCYGDSSSDSSSDCSGDGPGDCPVAAQDSIDCADEQSRGDGWEDDAAREVYADYSGSREQDGADAEARKHQGDGSDPAGEQTSGESMGTELTDVQTTRTAMTS